MKRIKRGGAYTLISKWVTNLLVVTLQTTMRNLIGRPCSNCNRRDNKRKLPFLQPLQQGFKGAPAGVPAELGAPLLGGDSLRKLLLRTK